MRDRHFRRSYAGNPVPRRPLVPGMLHRAPAPSGGRRIRIGAQVLLLLLLLPIIGSAVLGTTVYSTYAQTAAMLKPRLDALTNHKVFQTSRIFDRNGKLLYEFFDTGRRTKVPISEISPLLIHATVAIEDKTFFSNSGIDAEGIAKAIYRSLNAGEETGGASTITQQLVKRIILTDEERAPENRYRRKMSEIILAQELSNRFSKDDILELYLNEIFYGNLSYGIEAASNVYFKTHAKDLSLPQASLLAGLPQLPTYYDPINYLQKDAAGSFLPGIKLGDKWWLPDYKLSEDLAPPKVRQLSVLSQMVEEHYISEQQGRIAASEDLRFAPQEVPLNAPHFVFYVRKLLEEKYGQQLVNGGGLQITTTLDLDMQQMVQQKAAERIADLEKRNIHNAAVVVMQPNTGQILSMVGSIDYNKTVPTRTGSDAGNVLDGQVNVTTRERQPGSSLKPFTYLAAMEKGMTPATTLWDVPTEFPSVGGDTFDPVNYNGRWNGPVRIRTALANSLNMPAVKALKFAGIDYTLGLLDRVGIKTGLKRGADFYGLSLTLGGGEVTPLELTTAYNTLASGGHYVPSTPILKIVDGDGKVIEQYQNSQGQQVIRPELVSIISDMMSDDKARTAIWGQNSKLKLTRPAAVKTGTSNDWRDAWTLGFTPYVTVGVWSGNNNNEATAKVESLEGGGIIWHNVMEELFANPRYEQLLAQQFPNATVPMTFTLPTDKVFKQAICPLPGAFGGYSEELFTLDMLSAPARAASTAQAATALPAGTAASTRTTADKNVKPGCDVYKQVTVVRSVGRGGADTLPDGTQPVSGTAGLKQVSYCLPVPGETYPQNLLTRMYSWNFPPPDPSEKVQYTWSWGKGGGSVAIDNKNVSTLNVAGLRQCTPADVVPPTPVAPTPPVPDAIQMPNLNRLGENQAKEALARLGITSVYVDYQTRERVPDVFDQYAPYTVISTLPKANEWYIPGTTVVLGVRAPDNAAPAPVQPTAAQAEPPPAEPTAVPAEPPPATQPPVEAPPIVLPSPIPGSTPIPLPGSGIDQGGSKP